MSAVFNPRVVMETDAGDLVISLFPETAPRHAERLLNFVRTGGYDGASVVKLTEKYALISGGPRVVDSPLPPELSTVGHRLGVVSIARDGVQSGLAINLSDAPEMDGRFTTVGSVERGFIVLDALKTVPRGPQGVPKKYVGVRRAYVVETPGQLTAVILRGVERDFLYSRLPSLPPTALLGAGAALGLILAAASRFSGRRRTTWVGLLILLASFFGLFEHFAPDAQQSTWRGLLLFFSALAVFRLMSEFEANTTPKK